MLRRLWFRRNTRLTEPEREPGYGKRFAFSSDGETSFLNFTASEIVQIMTCLRNGDAMTSDFGSGS